MQSPDVTAGGEADQPTPPPGLISVLDRRTLLWQICAFFATRERLSLTAVCRAVNHAIRGLICVVNNAVGGQNAGDLSSSSAGGGDGDGAAGGGQQALVVMPAKMTSVREAVFERSIGSLLQHRETLKEVKIIQLGRDGGKETVGERQAGQQHGGTADAVSAPVRLSGPPSSVWLLATESFMGLFETQMRLHLHDSLNITALDLGLAHIIGSSPDLTHLNVFPLVFDEGHPPEYIDPQHPANRATPTIDMHRTVGALRNTGTKLQHLGHLLMYNDDISSDHLSSYLQKAGNVMTADVFWQRRPAAVAEALLRHLSPHPPSHPQTSSSNSSSSSTAPYTRQPPNRRQLRHFCPIKVDPSLPYGISAPGRTTTLHLIQTAEQRGWDVVRDGGMTILDCTSTYREHGLPDPPPGAPVPSAAQEAFVGGQHQATQQRWE
ncbi:unnamed protein product [Vitrella brassicaformis CCMP3155]|uniref:Uncharacterized protein n=1 Tax=Vitrella brassicaformis (strain CCMP3155) TaxID=1169540 RepID=A0A0G4ET86_VITBC|nr:unnamed protein product [Vitrella brassicaformis CCMP3155]|eukprot:CEM01352.1 unnamed protein product [Vitrella brassicaformis CCMP3155]